MVMCKKTSLNVIVPIKWNHLKQYNKTSFGINDDAILEKDNDINFVELVDALPTSKSNRTSSAMHFLYYPY